MGKIIILTGTPGAGKTTVLASAIKKADKKVEVFNYGDAMFEIARQRCIKSRDDMRRQPLEVQRDIQTRAAEFVSKKATGLAIVDTHSSISTPNGYLPGIPEWIAKELKPAVIILIEACPKQILKRRLKDKTRTRDKESIESIEEQQQINRMFAASYAAMTGASIKIIVNADKKLEKAAGELAQLINSL